jgi:hypothetical protein
MKRSALFVEDTLSWRPRSEGLTKRSLHRHYISHDLQIGSIFQGCEGHLQGSQIS